MRARLGGALFTGTVLLGTGLAAGRPAPSHAGTVMVADLHVHPFPGDGALTVGQLRREAVRRGVDVIAITAHNNQGAWRLDGATAADVDDEVIALPGQEVTAPGFHLIAVGIPRPVDWNRPAPDVIDEVHRLGGAAVAAHPLDYSWTARDEKTLARLDGVEVAHPAREQSDEAAGQIDGLFAAARRANPALSAIGSSDFHMTAPLGRSRTYVFVDERSPAGVVRALRAGQTVAEDADGRLFGPAELAARITPDLKARRTVATPSSAERACALAALTGLGMLSYPRRRKQPVEGRR